MSSSFGNAGKTVDAPWTLSDTSSDDHGVAYNADLGTAGTETVTWNYPSGTSYNIWMVTYKLGSGGQVANRGGLALSSISAINGITKANVSAINGLTI